MVYEQQQALASNYFNLGRSLAGEVAYEDMRTVDFIASHPQVDNQHIGVVGFSMGGFRAWQLAALSDKVAATAVISWFGTYNGLMQPRNNVLRGQSAFLHVASRHAVAYGHSRYRQHRRAETHADL